MSKKRILILKILGVFFVLLIVVLFVFANRAYKGIGDSVVNTTKAVYEISKSIEQRKELKIDSLKKYQKESSSKIECSEKGCQGLYHGPEFVKNSDIAHQFSNMMANKVGDKLKELYEDNIYSKVDFFKIKMSTVGMGSGSVVYRLKIPFQNVKNKCDAYTSFDHVGGWNHTPDLARRKTELKDVLIEGEILDISDLKTTPEGLQEYWIQWKNKLKQADCK